MGLREWRDKLRQLAGRGPKHDMAYYEAQYAKQLGNAFAGREAERSFLIFATRLFSEGRYTHAVKTLNGLWEKCENKEDRRAVLMFIALCLSRNGDTEGAINAYSALLQIDPENSTALSNLGNILQGLGKFQAAEEYYLRAMRCDPSNPFARNNLATLYYAMGEYELAIPHGEAALTLKANMYQAATVLGMCHMALGSRAEGERYGRLAIANGQNPEDMKNALKRAWESRFTGPVMSEEFEKVLRQWKRRTALPTNYVYATPRPVGRSRIGGPSLGEAPLDSSGKPMRLLCAIFCEEFRESPILPREGLLRIYIAENGLFGLDLDQPNVQKDFRVLYDKDYSHLSPGEDPGPSDRFPVKGCYGIRCGGMRKQAMPFGDYRFQEQFEALLAEMGAAQPTDEEMDTMSEINCPEGHRVGGYPWFTQNDPRENDPAYEKYDTLLFQLDCMEHPEMQIEIGDGGVMNFFIPGEKLEKLDFSDVLYNWDCH